MVDMFGIGLAEMLILGMVCLVMTGVPVVVLVVVLLVNRNKRDDG